jgi:membrane-bound lytic murein transglycosylase D
MKKIVIICIASFLFGCAGLTKNSKPAPKTNPTPSTKTLTVKNIDIENIAVNHPEFVYDSTLNLKEKITHIEFKETSTANTQNNQTKEQKLFIKSEKIASEYEPEFDTSFIFKENKKLRLNYNNLDNLSEEFGIPITMNDRVRKYLDRFTTAYRNTMQKWITNSYKYIFYVKDVLKNYGLPTELAYLPLAESGYNPTARSRAGAVGMWQFMPSTGKLYGLKINYWVDDRRDFEKSTDAAARHLKDLYEKFNDWNLALAAYNAGAGRIERAIDKFDTEDYFELSSFKHLAEETKDYVPKFTALMLIHKNLLQYGFEYPEIEPLNYEKVTLDYPVNLFILSKLIGVEMSDIIELNPSLRRWITPPNDTFELKVPLGYKEKVLAVLNSYSPEELLQVRIYTPNKRERVTDIAKKYKVSQQQIIAMNGLKKTVVPSGFPILIPSENGNIVITKKQLEQISSISDVSESSSKTTTYKVKKGDTIYKIATKFKTTPKAILAANKVKVIKAGMSLDIPLKTVKPATAKNSKKTTKTALIKYKVKKGDTIYKVASKYDIEPQEIIKINKTKNIKPGQTLLIPKS